MKNQQSGPSPLYPVSRTYHASPSKGPYDSLPPNSTLMNAQTLSYTSLTPSQSVSAWQFTPILGHDKCCLGALAAANQRAQHCGLPRGTTSAAHLRRRRGRWRRRRTLFALLLLQLLLALLFCCFSCLPILFWCPAAAVAAAAEAVAAAAVLEATGLEPNWLES